jgi:hypothetical protein
MIRQVTQWKSNRFEAYKPNTRETAIRNLPPGTHGEAAATRMLKAIEREKEKVIKLCNQDCDELFLDAAEVCNLTYIDKYDDTRVPCRKASHIGLAWKQCAGPENCKRMAFIFDYFGTVVYKRAFNTTHCQRTTTHVMKQMNIVMDVDPAEVRGGQRSCVEQQYSCSAKNRKNNILRGGGRKHHVRVSLQQDKATKTNKNWKRPKEVFFIERINSDFPDKKTVEKVRTI